MPFNRARVKMITVRFSQVVSHQLVLECVLYALRAAVAVGGVFGLVADVGVVHGEAGRQLHVAEVAVSPRVLR